MELRSLREQVCAANQSLPRHLTVYRARPDVMSVVRTHSTYATAFAASGQPIPCCLTAIADESGGLVPCGGYASIGGEEIGRELVAGIGSSPAFLMRQHGVFTIGRNMAQAVTAAVMVEDVARTVAIDLQSGVIAPLPNSQVRANHDRCRSGRGSALASRGVTR
jgi:L-ribulose-5-phosphate 4-epimerase